MEYMCCSYRGWLDNSVSTFCEDCQYTRDLYDLVAYIC